MKTWIIAGVVAVVALISVFLLVQKVSPLGWGWWGTYNTSGDLALKGYDPVAYFDSGQATQGKAEHQYEWNGATWQFATAANRERFVNAPDSYAPEFGGFCSFAVSKGFTANASPEAWHVHDGKLYLFADNNVRDRWVSGIGSGTLDTSTKNWSKR